MELVFNILMLLSLEVILSNQEEYGSRLVERRELFVLVNGDDLGEHANSILFLVLTRFPVLLIVDNQLLELLHGALDLRWSWC